MLGQNKKLWPACLIALCVVVLTYGLESLGVLAKLEHISYDWRMQKIRGDKVAPDDVAVILVDDASLNAMNPVVGRWPWPRSVHADVIDFLSLGEPKAILFDVLFVEHEKQLQEGLYTESDLRLAESTEMAGNVAHAMQLHRDEEDQVNRNLFNQPLPEHALAHALPNPHEGGSYNNIFYLPIEPVAQAVGSLGVVSTFADEDGVHRKSRLLQEYQGRLFPSLGLAPFAMGGNNRLLATIESPDFLVNYYKDINTYSMGGVIASAQQVMEGELEGLIVDPFEFENKIVFIGASAVGLEDLKATPLSANTPGVMIHASVVGNLLSGDRLTSVSLVYAWVSALLLAVGITLAVLFTRRLRYKIGSPLVIGGGYLALNYLAFEQNYVLNAALPMTALFLAAIISSAYLLFTESKDKRRVRTMLAQYVSPAVLNTVVDQYEDYAQAEVGSEEQLSILFSDIRGFTSLSEAVPAGQVVEMLNHYFSAMNETIFEYRGTIDKFIGDAIMAFWGAPVREEKHADLAVQSAIEMHYRLKGVNAWLEERNYPQVQIGVGINSGKVILGNIGSVHKLDYTVIGDNVNLASRLEGLTKQYGCTLVISEYTYELLTEPMPCHILDLVRVKGKQVPIRIYAPILDCSEDEAKQLEQTSQQGFQAYLDQQWGTAIELYQQLPDGVLKSTFIERCQSYQKTPPPPDWDGVFTMTSK